MPDFSFDIVSEVNLQELDNAVNQAIKEVITRYDFRGTAASISELNRKEKELTLMADSEKQLESVKQVLISKMIKRSVEPSVLDYQKLEAATHNSVRVKVKLKEGIDKELSKKIQTEIKSLKLKVNAQIQGTELRVSSGKKDDLQAVIQHLKANPPEVPLQFKNFR
jgi:uncharacterized protein YajQ (UPF0234 family)